ncbi:MAG: TerB family tellurite resistance protein [Salaquimonas sp.]
MGLNNCVDFEAMVLAAITKADQRVLPVEETTAVKVLHAGSPDLNMDASKRFVDAMKEDEQSSVLETLGKISADMPLEQKLALLRNCWRVAISDDELHPTEEALIYNVVDELKVSRRTFALDQQKLAS